MKLEIADIATNEKKRLQGFKVLGVFPFYLRYITVGTHVRLCRIKEELVELTPKGEQGLQEFYNSDLQSKITPLILQYCVIALLNNRGFSFFLKILLKRKLKKCGHYHILNLYMTITKLNNPAFFLTYWNWMTVSENTLLREEKPS